MGDAQGWYYHMSWEYEGALEGVGDAVDMSLRAEREGSGPD